MPFIKTTDNVKLYYENWYWDRLFLFTSLQVIIETGTTGKLFSNTIVV